MSLMQLITEKSKDYELLDSGGGEKLERYGEFVLRRPDPQAIWQKRLKIEWEKADAVYERQGTSGRWKKNTLPESWKINLEGISFNLSLLPSKHLGVFPEQVSQWKWLENKIGENIKEKKKISVLNLFGYTGGASMACATAGAEVVHLDASKFAVELASKNAKDSGLGGSSIRYIVDDVRKFVEREIKRGNKYDVITLDPPVYGKGTKGESWKIEQNLPVLLERIKKILSDKPMALVLNGYASLYSSQTYSNLLESIEDEFGGQISSGDLGIKESKGDRVLTAGIFARIEF